VWGDEAWIDLVAAMCFGGDTREVYWICGGNLYLIVV